MGIFPKYLEKFEIISKKVGKVPKYLESIPKNWNISKKVGINLIQFPKKLESFQNIWNQFQKDWNHSQKIGIYSKRIVINSKKIGILPKILEVSTFSI